MDLISVYYYDSDYCMFECLKTNENNNKMNRIYCRLLFLLQFFIAFQCSFVAFNAVRYLFLSSNYKTLRFHKDYNINPKNSCLQEDSFTTPWINIWLDFNPLCLWIINEFIEF